MKNHSFLLFLVLLNSLILGILLVGNPIYQLLTLGSYFLGLVLAYLAWQSSNSNWRRIWLFGVSYFNVILLAEFAYSGLLYSVFTLAGGKNPALMLGIGIIGGIVLAAWLVCQLFAPRFLIWTERYPSALKIINFNLRFFPRDANALFWRAIAQRALLNYDAALADYSLLIRGWLDKKQNKDVILPALVNRAEILIERRLLDAALKDVDLAHDIDPNYAFAYKLHAQILQEWEHYPQALEMIDEALDLQKELGFFMCKAQILSDMERYPEALAVVDKGQELVPNEMGLNVMRSVILLNSGDFAETIRFCEHLIPEMTDLKLAHTLRLNRAAAYFAAEDYAKAIPEYQSLLKLDLPSPYDKEIQTRCYYGMALINFKQGNYREAEQQSQAALELWPDFTVAMLGLLASQFKQGKDQLGKETWQKFQSIPSKYRNLKSYDRDKTFPAEILEIVHGLPIQGQLAISPYLQSDDNESMSKNKKD